MCHQITDVTVRPFLHLAHLVKCVPPVVREGPHLARPAALFDRLGPPRADKDVRAINLVYRAIAWAVMRYLVLGAADAHGKGLSCHPRHSAYTGYLEKIGDVLGGRARKAPYAGACTR
jgi:hypothetical protein